MSSNEDAFQISGPVHLSSINWSCPDDQRVVVASLVNATYILEKNKVLAPAWWQHFHFECIEKLKDRHDGSIFCCIFELNPPFSLELSAPRFVVTFRGTMINLEHVGRDGYLDILVVTGGINKSYRVDAAIEAVGKVLSKTGSIWLGGHSLGASIATVTGKYYFTNKSINLKTFLFNPPFPSVSLDWFSKLDNNLRDGLRICKTVLKGTISLLKKKQRMKLHEEFSKLATWTPYLFVNRRDLISMGYVPYFEGRKKRKSDFIIGYLEQFATHTSLRQIFSDLLGSSSEMSHLLPSAYLAVNKKEMLLIESHALRQWWQQDINLNCSDHHYLSQEDEDED